ncbi:MAG TPA: class I SAM-dependent methyltransferase, partial [Methanotrichaceae archaeon]|nr:class I SAM-dependent methyltransferase [Methanotrichaceae archaeon]
LVILGAGYDSRAYRMEGLKAIKVFEMDHSTTQTAKLEKSLFPWGKQGQGGMQPDVLCPCNDRIIWYQ